MYAHQVEFVGGPLDGYTFQLTDPSKELVPLATLPVSDNTFRWMSGERPSVPVSPTSVAIYVRETLEATTRFCFVRSLPTHQVVHVQQDPPQAA